MQFLQFSQTQIVYRQRCAQRPLPQFCSLLIGTIIKTLGLQLGVQYLTDIGAYAMSVSGPAMAVAIGYALKADPMVLFSLAAVGWAANAEGGAGGPLAVLIIAIVAAECGKAVSKETKVDILVTPAVTILVGVALAKLIAPPIGTAASAFGIIIDNATKLQPFWMGIAVSVLVGVALTLPISSAAICSVLGLTGLAGGAAVAGCCAQMVGFAVMSFRENRWGGLVTFVEFCAGCVLNLWLGLDIWDYSDIPFNLLGQICLPFSLVWWVLCFLFIVVFDWMRYAVIGGDKPTYSI